jgi:hypothetical protein
VVGGQYRRLYAAAERRPWVYRLTRPWWWALVQLWEGQPAGWLHQLSDAVEDAAVVADRWNTRAVNPDSELFAQFGRDEDLHWHFPEEPCAPYCSAYEPTLPAAPAAWRKGQR